MVSALGATFFGLSAAQPAAARAPSSSPAHNVAESLRTGEATQAVADRYPLRIRTIVDDFDGAKAGTEPVTLAPASAPSRGRLLHLTA